MKLTPKRNASIPHAHWKLKRGRRMPSGSTCTKRPYNTYDTQELGTASFSEMITF
ncbi:hypothetical protein [Runella slithyformis]|uniref:hypothetical protein n=1 Tax=Runella slithyformis TaxID=106 RepID=UPI00146CB9EC|nr:hypothetical protein [Runella slithyformis]